MKNIKINSGEAVAIVFAFTFLLGIAWPLLSVNVLDAIPAYSDGMQITPMLVSYSCFAMMIVGVPMGIQIGQIVCGRPVRDAGAETHALWLALSCLPVTFVFLIGEGLKMATSNPAPFLPGIRYFLLVQALPILWFNYNVSSLIRRRRWS